MFHSTSKYKQIVKSRFFEFYVNLSLSLICYYFIFNMKSKIGGSINLNMIRFIISTERKCDLNLILRLLRFISDKLYNYYFVSINYSFLILSSLLFTAGHNLCYIESSINIYNLDFIYHDNNSYYLFLYLFWFMRCLINDFQ